MLEKALIFMAGVAVGAVLMVIKGHSNFKGQCSMCFNRNYKPMCEDCDTCDKQHSKWRQA